MVTLDTSWWVQVSRDQHQAGRIWYSVPPRPDIRHLFLVATEIENSVFVQSMGLVEFDRTRNIQHIGRQKMQKKANQLQIGEEYEPLVFRVTPKLNEQFVKALDGFHSRYKDIVHPGLLLNFCSITQSPSFYLQQDVAAVGAKFKGNYINSAKVGKTFTVSWKVIDNYDKRSRSYQICDVLLKDDDGLEILRREISNTFVGGEYLRRRVKWERETGYRRAVSISEFPGEGYEIVGKARKLTLEKQRYYSGGLPGPEWPARNIHTDREISIRAGIGKPIASGLMFESYLAELMINFFGEDWFSHGETDVIAIDMAGDGDTIFPKAVIKSKEVNGTKCKVGVELWCENQYGNKMMVGTAIFSGGYV